MSTVYTGLTGKVKIGGEVAYISNWSVDISREIIEVPALGKKCKSKLPGQISWTASADGTVCFGDDGRAGHKSLFDAMSNGTKVRCEFFLYCKEGRDRTYYVPNADSTPQEPLSGTHNTKPSVKFYGDGLVESLSVDLSAEDKGNISISISGISELSYPGGQDIVVDDCNCPTCGCD